MQHLQRSIEQLERTPWTPLDREIENLMLALLDMGLSQDELKQLISEVNK